MRRVPKNGGGWRALCEPGTDLAATYEKETAALVRRLEPGIDPAAFANRTRVLRGRLILDDPFAARRRFAKKLRRLSADHRGPFVVADVLDCYASISLDAVLESIPPVGRGLPDVLSRTREAGVRGLPIGPAPSALLANAVLSGLDRAVRDSGARHLRWVDDLVVAVDSLLQARVLLDSLAREAERRGLALNQRKTGIVEDREALIGEPSAGPAAPLA